MYRAEVCYCSARTWFLPSDNGIDRPSIIEQDDWGFDRKRLWYVKSYNLSKTLAFSVILRFPRCFLSRVNTWDGCLNWRGYGLWYCKKVLFLVSKLLPMTFGKDLSHCFILWFIDCVYSIGSIIADSIPELVINDEFVLFSRFEIEFHPIFVIELV